MDRRRARLQRRERKAYNLEGSQDCRLQPQAKTNQADGDTDSPVPPKEPQSRKCKQDKTDQADGADKPAPCKKPRSRKPKQDKTDRADGDTDPALAEQAPSHKAPESEEQAAPAEPCSSKAPRLGKPTRVSVPSSSSPQNPVSGSQSSEVPMLSTGLEAVPLPSSSHGDKVRASPHSPLAKAADVQQLESAPQNPELPHEAISDGEKSVDFGNWLMSDVLAPSSEPDLNEMDDHVPVDSSRQHEAWPRSPPPRLPPQAHAPSVQGKKTSGPQQASAAPVGSVTSNTTTSGVTTGADQALLNKKRLLQARNEAMQSAAVRARSPPRQQPPKMYKQVKGVGPQTDNRLPATQSDNASQGASGSGSSGSKKKILFHIPCANY
ncbi:hypothetical protein FRC06_009673 [Ceratobasidium sp. 370]|nr:hypothetical protein FRC06_009673 [Ceratobasidium sp. 370]